VRVQQCETGAVVEAAIKVDGLDAEVKAVEEVEKLGEDIAGGVASDELAHRQRAPLVPYPCIERGVGVKRGRSTFRLREVQCLCLVFITVVGIEVEVGNDLHRSIRQCLKSISLEECVPNRLNRVKFELIGEISTDGVGVGRVVGRFAYVVDRGPAGAGAGEDLVQFLRCDFDVLAEIYRKLLVKAVNDKIKQVFIFYLVVCLALFPSSPSRRFL